MNIYQQCIQIDPKRAIPRAEHERTAKVFVGGLAPSVTGESLKSFLCQFGQVMDATVMFDKETGRSKGFAFATFQDEESVGRAMAASGVELEGKQVSRTVFLRQIRWLSRKCRLKSRKLSQEVLLRDPNLEVT